ncbi:hypothetical protein QUA43_01050, partial [Microcoleus sp. N9_B4]|uniref:hypothetical protein n=1 Tax=Microcoleus sp. N9_B4 TaxID=3055386 RepID=UPI002FD43C95
IMKRTRGLVYRHPLLLTSISRRRKKQEGRGKREEGRGKREEGRGKREEGRHDTDFDTDTRINYRGFVLMFKEEGRRITRGLVDQHPLLLTSISSKTEILHHYQ